MKCVNHPDREATEQCVFCKDVLCDDCAFEIGNEVYACDKCYDKYITKSQNEDVAFNQNNPNQQKSSTQQNSNTNNKQESKNNGCGCLLICIALILLIGIMPIIGSALGTSDVKYRDTYTKSNHKETTSNAVVTTNSGQNTISKNTNDETTALSYSSATTANNKFNISKEDLPNYSISSFDNISSRNSKRMRFKITLSDRRISQEDVINIGKFFYDTLIVDLNENYGYIDGFQILIYGDSDSQSWGATIGSISYNINGSKKFQDASVVKSWENAPLERDFQIVGALMEALAKSNEKESVINQRIADKYGISVEELHNMYLETSNYRFPSKFDIE